MEIILTQKWKDAEKRNSGNGSSWIPEPGIRKLSTTEWRIDKIEKGGGALPAADVLSVDADMLAGID